LRKKYFPSALHFTVSDTGVEGGGRRRRRKAEV
jgi:hypothetical protein